MLLFDGHGISVGNGDVVGGRHHVAGLHGPGENCREVGMRSIAVPLTVFFDDHGDLGARDAQEEFIGLLKNPLSPLVPSLLESYGICAAPESRRHGGFWYLGLSWRVEA